MFRLFKHSRRDDSGAAAVEFALVSLLLVTLLIGILQFGYIFYQWVEITSAAREGARWAALRHDGGSVAIPDTTRFKVSAAAPGMNPPLTDAQITISPEDPDDTDVGTPVTVTVEHDVPLFAPMMQTIFGVDTGSITLRSTATMRVE